MLNKVLFGCVLWAITMTSALAANVAQDTPREVQALPSAVVNYLKRHRIPEQDIGVYIQEVNADEPLLLHQADSFFNPASAMKVVTTWSAIKAMGPARTWNTEAWVRGDIRDGVLYGDLILKGYGDPFLVHESFWQFVHDIRLKGLREIQGDILIDNSFFEIPHVDPGAFDGQPTRMYNAPPSALMFNFQATRLLLSPDLEQRRVNISAFPMPKGAVIDNQMRLIRGDCNRWHTRPTVNRLSNGTIRISGEYAESCGQRFSMMVMSEPEEHAFNAFHDFWTMLGGSIHGSHKAGKVQSGDRRFHVHTSSGVAEQVRLINKWSNNVMTRQLLLSIGARMFGEPATLEKGRLAVLSVLRDHHIPTQGLVVENGSGLSRDERISPEQMGLLLRAIWNDPYMPELLNSLPLLGEDGTLASRMRRSDLQGKGRLKTGTLRDASAIAGYMLTRDGRYMIVVVFHNGRYASGHGRTVQNMLLEWVFDYQ